MSSVSRKQERFMAAVANNPKFAKEAGVPQSVGQEFFQVDQAKKRRDSIARAIVKVRGRQ